MIKISVNTVCFVEKTEISRKRRSGDERGAMVERDLSEERLSTWQELTREDVRREALVVPRCD